MNITQKIKESETYEVVAHAHVSREHLKELFIQMGEDYLNTFNEDLLPKIKHDRRLEDEEHQFTILKTKDVKPKNQQDGK